MFSTSNQHRSIWTLLLAFGLGAGISLLDCHSARSVNRETLILLTTPLEPTLFQPGQPSIAPDVVTPDRISQTGLTPPSLWWAQEQYGNNLLSYWLAYPGTDGTPRRVDLLVDQEVWGNYNYVDRYAFMSKFGIAAKAFGYNMRVFNLQGDLLGAYICEFGDQANLAAESANASAACSIFLNATGRGAFSGSTNPFGALSPTGAGTGQY